MIVDAVPLLAVTNVSKRCENTKCSMWQL